MSLRSIRINLRNNTPYQITEYHENLCHGDWSTVSPNQPNPTPGWFLPSSIAPSETVQWSTHQHDTLGISLSGVEGWVKYSVQYLNPGYTAEGEAMGVSQYLIDLLWIYWDNPYIWDPDTMPIRFNTYPHDVAAPNSYCENGDPWPGFGSYPPGNTPATEVFLVGSTGPSAESIEFGNLGNLVWSTIVAWPLIVIEGFADAEQDIDLQFTLGLRQNGSILQSINGFYDGKLGLRALAVHAAQPSLKKLFGL